jgi:hypothetical protein
MAVFTEIERVELGKAVEAGHGGAPVIAPILPCVGLRDRSRVYGGRGFGRDPFDSAKPQARD